MIRNIAFVIASVISFKAMALCCENLFERQILVSPQTTAPVKKPARSALEKYKANQVSLGKIAMRLPI